MPASPETRSETGIAWYEVQVHGSEKRLHIAAFNTEGVSVETADVQSLSNETSTLTISENGRAVLAATMTFERGDTGETRIRTQVGDEEIDVTGSSSDPDSVRPSGQLEKTKLPEHWERLGDPLMTLAEALKERAVDSKSWGCTSCMVLEGGVLVTALGCIKTLGAALPACGAALVGAALFIENCHDVC